MLVCQGYSKKLCGEQVERQEFVRHWHVMTLYCDLILIRTSTARCGPLTVHKIWGCRRQRRGPCGSYVSAVLQVLHASLFFDERNCLMDL